MNSQSRAHLRSSRRMRWAQHHMGMHRRPGVAVVELAVILPLFVLLFLITADFARVSYYSVTVENCASNAVMFGTQADGSVAWQGAIGELDSASDAAFADATSM